MAIALGFLSNGGVLRAEVPAFMQKPSPQHVRVLCYNVNWDSVFEDGDPQNHPWREHDRSDSFVRIVTALNPDVVCLQEINADRDPQDVGDILDAALPLGTGQTWRAHKGSDNVIAARYDLSMLRTDTVPSTNRGQAMALVDLPDSQCARDLYLMNAHFKASGGDSNIARRQQHADAIINWVRDIKTTGGSINLLANTPILVLGDLNVYDTDPHYHLTTLVTGDVVNEGVYGPDTPPDWDESNNTDALPLHNGIGPDSYTWRNDMGTFNAGALDRIVFTDSCVTIGNAFVLNTTAMSPADLAAAGLLANDVVLENVGSKYNFDHLPLVVDLLIPPPIRGDADGDGDVDLVDFARFLECLTGAACDASPCDPPAWTLAPLGWPSAYCPSMDFDSDGDVDLRDFAGFQFAFTP